MRCGFYPNLQSITIGREEYQQAKNQKQEEELARTIPVTRHSNIMPFVNRLTDRLRDGGYVAFAQ